VSRHAGSPAVDTWALLVGIDDARGEGTRLRGAAADADAVDALLARRGVPREQRLLLRNGDATERAIESGFAWLSTHATNRSTAVILFAGHARKLASETEAVVTADGILMPDTRLASLMQPVRAARSWILLATCYAAGFQELLGPGRVLTAATGSSTRAFENTKFKNSYLVRYLIQQTLMREQHLSVQDAFARARDRLAVEHPDRVPVQMDVNETPLYI
jgi:hypothetical protein